MCKAANSSGHSFPVAFSLFCSTPFQWFLVLLVWKIYMYFGSFCCDWGATSLPDIRCSGYHCGWWVILACIRGCTAVGCASFATSIVYSLSEVCEAANPSGHSFSVAFSLFWSTPIQWFLILLVWNLTCILGHLVVTERLVASLISDVLDITVDCEWFRLAFMVLLKNGGLPLL